MKFLSVHCDYIKFRPLKKALKKPEELSGERQNEVEVKNPLVVFTAIEKQDESNQDIVKQYVEQVENIADQVSAKAVVLYPFAHLSPSLSNPDFALKTLEEAEKSISKNFTVSRAPFGFYKEFELKCKGHPLSELSRTIGNDEQAPSNESKKILDTEKPIDHEQLLREIGRAKLDTSKLKENDHRILGQRMDLFSFNDVAPGSIFWHKNGQVIYNQLTALSRKLHEKYDYDEIAAPQILDNKLWKISGHWDHYKDNMFLTEYESKAAGIKPMNCPGMMLVYNTKTRSYKDLPIRLFEFGVVHRKELSGVLAGLFRVVRFTQDDSHIFCTKDHIKTEMERIFELIDDIYKKTFDFEYRLELSTRPEKFLGDKKDWDMAEKALEDALKAKKLKYKVNEGDGAFYGPKIDLHIKDSLKREWQCATIQLDMQMPKRFGCTYVDKDNKIKTPLVIHRAIFGSIERFIGILLEHTNGNLPLWLAPQQVRIINFTDRTTKSCQRLAEELNEKGFRVSVDLDQKPINGKIKEAELGKINYIVVIGDKEEENHTLAIRHKGKVQQMPREQFIEKIQKEVQEKKE